jgi:hypothetical protein
MTECKVCEKPIQGEVFYSYVEVSTPNYYANQPPHISWEYVPTHIDCMENDQRPDEYKVCDVCGITGKDADGKYAGAFIQGTIQHPAHIDWDDVRKYGR